MGRHRARPRASERAKPRRREGPRGGARTRAAPRGQGRGERTRPASPRRSADGQRRVAPESTRGERAEVRRARGDLHSGTVPRRSRLARCWGALGAEGRGGSERGGRRARGAPCGRIPRVGAAGRWERRGPSRLRQARGAEPPPAAPREMPAGSDAAGCRSGAATDARFSRLVCLCAGHVNGTPVPKGCCRFPFPTKPSPRLPPPFPDLSSPLGPTRLSILPFCAPFFCPAVCCCVPFLRPFHLPPPVSPRPAVRGCTEVNQSVPARCNARCYSQPGMTRAVPAMGLSIASRPLRSPPQLLCGGGCLPLQLAPKNRPLQIICDSRVMLWCLYFSSLSTSPASATSSAGAKAMPSGQTMSCSCGSLLTEKETALLISR